MNERELLNRITATSDILAGKPVIRGTRLSVEFILNLMASGASVADVLDEYPGLTDADIRACYLFASHSLGDATFLPLATGSA